MTRKRDDNRAVEILVVEDSATQAEQLRLLLEEQGYRVTVAGNGRAALEALREARPTLVITDIVMPEMDGYALCAAIKSDASFKEIPVVIVTSLAGIQDIAKSLECGADNFIRKPYDPTMLMARIDYILLNLELRKHRKIQVGMEVMLHGKKHFITSDREQIVDLLISTYEEAVRMNEELAERQKQIAHSNQTLAGMYRIAEQLNRVTTETEVCDKALQGAAELPSFHAGWIYLRDAYSGTRAAAVGDLPEALTVPGAMAGDCECRRLLSAGETPRETRIVECEHLRRHGAVGAAGTHVSTPLWAGDRCLGVLNLMWADRAACDVEDLKNLETVGSQVSIALERAQLHQHLEMLVEQRTAALQAEIAERTRAEERVAGLNRIYAVLSGINGTIIRIRDRQELCKEACRIAVEFGQFSLAWIGLITPDSEHLTTVAWTRADDEPGSAGAVPGYDVAAQCRTLIELVLRDRITMVCNDVTANTDQPYAREALAHGYRSLIVLPLLVEGRGAGVLALYTAEPGVFDAGELKLLEELAGDIAFALEYIAKDEKLNYLAYYDVLTGLANRSLFYDRLNQLLHGGGRLALLTINIEHFTRINDTFGRNVGDALLKDVAGRLGKAMGSVDRLARIGADYFTAILTDFTVEAEIARVLDDQILESLSRPFHLDGKEMRIAVKVGIALFPSDGDNAEALFTNAETALKKAKTSSDRYVFYAPKMNARVAEKLTLENKLRQALEKEEFVLHYQPVVNLQSGAIIGLEALLRWNDPDTGMIPPNDFIPLLEETGMIIEVGRWALERAIADYHAWHAIGLHPPRVAVNVSAVQLRRKDFLSTVEKVLALRTNGADYLDLEITESLIMEDIEANIPRLRTIREMGVKIAVDDFGTGYSSLSYIAKLPIDALKIDRAFIVDMTSNPDDAIIVSSIISLAHALKLRVIAEGVETEEQSKFLKLLKCDEMQGFIFSPPVSPVMIETMLRDRNEN